MNPVDDESESVRAARYEREAATGDPGDWEEVPSCFYCGPTEEELRPYGPKGAEVCFPCATSTPERRACMDMMIGAAMFGESLLTDEDEATDEE